MQMFFFAVADDMRELMKQADSQNLVVLPAKYRVGDEPKPEDAMRYAVEEAEFLLLPREYSLDDVMYIEGSKGKAGTAEVDLDESPVIKVAPSVLWGTKLDAGYLAINEESSDRRFSLIERKMSFFVNQLKRWHRTEKNQGFVGPATAKLVKEHRIQLGLGKKRIELWRSQT